MVRAMSQFHNNVFWLVIAIYLTNLTAISIQNIYKMKRNYRAILFHSYLRIIIDLALALFYVWTSKWYSMILFHRNNLVHNIYWMNGKQKSLMRIGMHETHHHTIEYNWRITSTQNRKMIVY